MLSESIQIAFNALAVNKLRSTLTMLGITIGVAAVITLLSVGDGVSRYVTAQFEGLGTNLVFVFPGQFNLSRGPRGMRSGGAALTDADWQALADPQRLPGAEYTVPMLRRSVTVSAGNFDAEAPLRATTADYLEARNYQVAFGRNFTESEFDERARVVVIGQTTVNRLFTPDQNPLEASVRINGVPFKVVGILAEKGGSVMGDEDDTLIVPLSTATTRLFVTRTASGDTQLSIILIKVPDAAAVDPVVFGAGEVLRERHRIPFRGEDDFTLLSDKDLQSAFGQVTGLLTLFLGSIAAISLLVGGIGIMNIMLVTVTERTREIGLRKAVGATRAHILVQFLMEAITLSLLGGTIGIGLGALGASLIHFYVPELDTTIQGSAVVLAAGFSFAVGLFFGIYPAYRASSLSPIAALRYE
jgi:putative ABC transport system permease protein